MIKNSMFEKGVWICRKPSVYNFGKGACICTGIFFHRIITDFTLKTFHILLHKYNFIYMNLKNKELDLSCCIKSQIIIFYLELLISAISSGYILWRVYWNPVYYNFTEILLKCYIIFYLVYWNPVYYNYYSDFIWFIHL